MENYVAELSNYKTHTLKLSEKGFEFSQDSVIRIETWSNIKSVSIEDDFISLKSLEESYCIPAQSMSTMDFKN